MESDSARGFLLGFIAGEGSFMIEVGAIERRRWNINISPRFSLLVHEDKILQNLMSQTNLGNVNKQKKRSMWNIQSIDECLELCEIIDESSCELFEDTNKYEQYKDWKKCLKLIDKGKHKKREGAHKLVDLSFDLGKESKRKHSRKYYHNKIEEAGDYICGGETKSGRKCQRHVAKKENKCQHHK